jgi:hypothetical protein
VVVVDVVTVVETAALAQKPQQSAVGWDAGAGHSRWAWASVMSSVCSHSQRQRQNATWGVLVHSVVAVAADELVPLANLLTARCSALGLHLELVLTPVLVPACELGPEPGLDEAACSTCAVDLVPAPPLTDVPSHRLLDFDLEPVPPCKVAAYGQPYWAPHRLVGPRGFSFVEGKADVVVELVEAEAAPAKAGE